MSFIVDFKQFRIIQKIQPISKVFFEKFCPSTLLVSRGNRLVYNVRNVHENKRKSTKEYIDELIRRHRPGNYSAFFILKTLSVFFVCVEGVSTVGFTIN